MRHGQIQRGRWSAWAEWHAWAINRPHLRADFPGDRRGFVALDWGNGNSDPVWGVGVEFPIPAWVDRWLDRRWLRRAQVRTYARGEELGCPDCATGEPHVCPFLMADDFEEPKRTRVLEHMRRELEA